MSGAEMTERRPCTSRRLTVAGPTVPGPTVTVAGPTNTQYATVTTTPTKSATHTQVVTKTYTPPVKVALFDGTVLVGMEIAPGMYHTDGQGDGGGCYWERQANGNGGLDSIIANDNIDGPTSMTVQPSDYAFKSSGGCQWSKIG